MPLTFPPTSLTVYSGVGDPSASYVLAGPNPNLPNSRVLSASAGISLNEAVPGSVTVGLQVQGQGGIGVTTGSSGQIILSGSGGPWSAFFGQGGTTVTESGTQVTVSSSIYADLYSNYVVVGTPDSENSNERQLVTQGGVSLTDHGAGGTLVISSSLVTVTGSGGVSVSTGGGTTYTVSSSLVTVAGAGGSTVTTGGGTTYTVSSSIGADLYAPYALVAADSELPNARRLVAGANITLTDAGAGSTLTIASTGGGGGITAAVSSSFMAASETVPALVSGTVYIMLKTANQAMTATLPNPASFQNSVIFFKDIQGFASASSLSTVLIQPTSNLTTIDALSSSYTFQSPWGRIGFVSPDGISWFIV